MLSILLLISYYVLPWWGVFFLGRLLWVIYRAFKPSKMVVYMKDAYFISLFFYFLTLLFLIYGIYMYFNPNSRIAIDVIMFLPLLFGSHLMAEFIRHIAGKRLSPTYKETEISLREIDSDLFSAVTNNDINSVLYCLNAGADPTVVNDLGYSAEDYARGYGYTDIQSLIKQNITSDCGVNPSINNQ